MTVQIEVSPEILRTLEEKAEQQGLALGEFVRGVVEREAQSRATRQTTTAESIFAERMAAFHEFNAGAQKLAPYLERVPPAVGATWNRDEIYQGLEERILGLTPCPPTEASDAESQQ